MEENEKLRVINKNNENIVHIYNNEQHQIKQVLMLFVIFSILILAYKNVSFVEFRDMSRNLPKNVKN